MTNANASGQLQIALYQPVANGGYQLTSILPNSPAVFTGLKEGTYRVDAYEITGSDTCRAGSRLVTVDCDTTVSGCNIRIKAVDSQNAETDVLPRVGGILQPLLLSVEHLDGASLAGYQYQWSRTSGTSAAVSLGTSPTLSATAIGEYAVKLIGATDTCVAYLTVRSKPCTPRTHTYACGTTPAIPMPDNGSRLSNLAPGDTIRAADFDIIVTEVSGGGSEGWNGIGYAEIPYLQGSRIAIELKGVVVNDCYELVGGTAQSAYDGSWGNIKNADRNTHALLAEIRTFLEDYSGKPEEISALNNYIAALSQDTTLAQVKQSLTAVSQCGTLSDPGGRLAATSNTCAEVLTEAKNTTDEVLNSITLAPENNRIQANVVALDATEAQNISNTINSYRLLGTAGQSQAGEDFTPNLDLQPSSPVGRSYYDQFVLEWSLDSSPCETENPNTSACTTYLTEYSRLQRKLSQSKLCPQLTNNFLFDKLYSSLANASLISTAETAIAQRYTERYKQNNDSDYFDTQDLSEILIDKQVGKDLFNRIAGVFNMGMKIRKGDISKISLNNVLKNNPVFLPNLQASDGVILLAFIGGTQQIEVRLVNTVFQQQSGVYDTELIVRIFDDFGVEERDYFKPLLTSFDISASWVPAPLRALINDGKQGVVDKLMRGPLFAFWVLQHQRNIKPFRAIYTYKLTFRGNFN